MKPCKIEAMTLAVRPSSARKSIPQPKRYRSTKKVLDDSQLEGKMGLQNIAPWSHIDDDFI